MRSFPISCIASSLGVALCAVLPAEVLEERAATATQRADPQCTNGPTTRGCWKNGYSIATDFDQKFPLTGNTVTYNLRITNGTCNPDGHGDRLCLLINNQYPGPTIRATWGDQVVVNVQNSMQDNGTSIHWHGVRQYHSNGDDGVNGITECSLAPGDSKTYSFLATQFGTSWYHSHFSSQYGDGVVGPMIFDGPATANYDIDLGPYPVTDWYYPTAFAINALASSNLQAQNGPPSADTILINGTNQNAAGGGQYNKVVITSGKKYRLRIVNTSVDNYIHVSLDSHQLQVISADFIPVVPFTTNMLLIAIGQRYDVIITANQPPGNYWFRANVASGCLSSNNFYGRAIWSYDSVTPATPSTNAYTEPSDCTEPTPSPYWNQPVPSGTFQSSLTSIGVNLTAAVVVPGGDAIVVWALNSTSINVQWDRPTLKYIREGNTSYPSSLAIHPTLSAGSWNYYLIQQLRVPPIPHPIHLHGHDFFVLGAGPGQYSSSSKLNFATPPRRDTATVPGGGWLAIAFNSNNPGAWLMHCHIAWHVSEGLALQFLESPGSIVMPDQTAFDRTCSNWKAYESTMYWHKDDSGL